MEDGVLMIEGNVDAAYEIINLIKAPAKKTETKKAPAKKSTAQKTVKAEKEIVKATKRTNSKIAKDIKK